MESPLDDNVLTVLDDYWAALQREETQKGQTTRTGSAGADGQPQSATSFQPEYRRAFPTDDGGTPQRAFPTDDTGGYLELLEELEAARRMLQEDSRAQDEELLPQSELPSIPERFGRYVIRRLLGSGGMGAVYLAHDTQLERDVALKIPQFSRFRDGATRERFQREARAAATLHHPNICPVFDSGETEGVPYLTMAFIDGQPLSCPAPADGFGPREVVARIRKVALALDYAHSQGVVHRDLKPGNIMVDQRGEPIVVDFGLARRAQVADITLTQPGLILGSVAYMSPEQALGEQERIGAASDIYTLGVILHELLTGRLPYRGRRSSVMGHIVSSAPVELDRELDPRLNRICARALAKPIEERFATMAEFAAALQEYLDGNRHITACAATPAPSRSLFESPIRRWTAILILMMLAGVACGALVVVKLQTSEGTLIVEVDEPGATITVMNDRGEVVVSRASQAGKLKFSVDRGKHRLKVEKDGFALFVKEFSISAGKAESIKATLLPPPPVAAEPSQPMKPAAIPPPSGLVAWWSGDGHARDYVGENHGILLRGATFATGLVGEAFSLDGFNDTVCVPNSDTINPSLGFTFECWIYPKSTAGWQKFISKWALPDAAYGLQKVSETDVLRFDLTESPPSRNDLAMLDGKSRILVNRWTHIAATYGGDTARVYFDGRLDGEVFVGPGRPIHRSSADLLIGSNTGHCFCGLMDELCLYDRALSAAEIEAIYVAGAAGKIKPVSAPIAK